jgi:hypothetical protein
MRAWLATWSVDRLNLFRIDYELYRILQEALFACDGPSLAGVFAIRTGLMFNVVRPRA